MFRSVVLPRDVYRSGNRQTGTILLVFGVLGLIGSAMRAVLDMPGPLGIPHPLGHALALGAAVALILLGLALRRGYPWARWVALGWAMLVIGQSLLLIHFRGAETLNPVGAAIATGVLLAIGFFVRYIWKHGPHVAG